jgi:hypothetical protein
MFSVCGNKVSLFPTGQRVRATVTAGIVYATIGNCNYIPFNDTTSVYLFLDDGNLDAGLSSIRLGIMTPNNNSLPNCPLLTNEDQQIYFAQPSAVGKTFLISPPCDFSLPHPELVPNGATIHVINDNSDISGIVHVIHNGTYQNLDVAILPGQSGTFTCMSDLEWIKSDGDPTAIHIDVSDEYDAAPYKNFVSSGDKVLIEDVENGSRKAMCLIGDIHIPTLKMRLVTSLSTTLQNADLGTLINIYVSAAATIYLPLITAQTNGKGFQFMLTGATTGSMSLSPASGDTLRQTTTNYTVSSKGVLLNLVADLSSHNWLIVRMGLEGTF